jgi:cytochrome c oxidase assembly protein Cox11
MRKMHHDVEHGKEDHIASRLQNVKEQKRICLMQCSQFSFAYGAVPLQNCFCLCICRISL